MNAHTSKVIISKENNKEGNGSASQKICQFVQDCANVCILDLRKHWWKCLSSPRRERFVRLSKASNINCLQH
jgi:hypothetical protein